jgi:hypothetical protein
MDHLFWLGEVKAFAEVFDESQEANFEGVEIVVFALEFVGLGLYFTQKIVSKCT